ncbi:MAG: helix-turn-helix domain-containing protein, partial [Opitutaceae bacterium]
ESALRADCMRHGQVQHWHGPFYADFRRWSPLFSVDAHAGKRRGWCENAGMKSQNTAAGCAEIGGEIRRFSKAKAIAEKLGVCPRTVFRWADEGRLARHKINARVVLFDEAEVFSMIETSRVQQR